ncbi:MAG: phosphoribosylformylglycinamidine synthase subunit PurL [Myxococcales bacterium]|nr:phosphoribosylformylglycinamidine synthase subunit PurL [Myxococcales bacterium]
MAPETITPALIEDHGLTPDEYQQILAAIGEEPTLSELGIFSVMWSEHCSYKSSRAYFKHFPTKGPRVLQGPGENAGIIDIGEGLCVVFKMESHNHPSFIEPFQGAATGVGGIMRDIFTMGARPIASLNSLHFGAPEHPRTKYLVNGVVRGIAHYGNCMGVPMVGGEVHFDACYNGNILVNAFCLGIARHDEIFKGKATGLGNPVIYVGSKTGRDGIHGATMASEAFDDAAQERRPTVQVGDPFTEKLLLEACLEVMRTGAVVGIQDMGAAGLTCSTFEMASRGGTGMEIELGRVPTRAAKMSAYEILLSESQERMLLVAAKGREDEVLAVFQKWDLDAVVIGHVTDGERVRIRHHGETVVDLPVHPVCDGAPIYERPQGQMQPPTLPNPHPEPIHDANRALLEFFGTPIFGDRSVVYEQYDHMVQTNTVVRPGADAAVLRIPGSTRGLALTTDVNARFCRLDPYKGAVLAVAEAARNLACVGAEPLGVTDCLNFGNPQNPGVMGQFVQAVKGIGDACRFFRIPVVSGNVSFYNETEGTQIYPTPTIAMVGLVDEPRADVSGAFVRAGDRIAILGSSRGGLPGSLYQLWRHGGISGGLPAVDLEAERRVQMVVRQAIGDRWVTAAHDLSDGGMAVALLEMAVRSAQLGCSILSQPEGLTWEEWLFGEDHGRVLITYHGENEERLFELAEQFRVPFEAIGRVDEGRVMIPAVRVDLEWSAIHEVWRAGLRRVIE